MKWKLNGEMYGKAIHLSGLIVLLLLVFGITTPGWAQVAGGAPANRVAGVIPPPDESHAMKPIGICGVRHFESRLEFCDTRNNHVYRYVTIRTQAWMAENLDFGQMVPGDRDQTKPGEKYCLHDKEGGCAALYQWAEAMGLDASFNAKPANLTGKVKGICPSGWHVPNSSEWQTLLSFVDKEQGQENEAASLMAWSQNDDFKWKTNTDPDSMMPRDKYGFAVVSTGQRVLKASCPVGKGNLSYFCNAHDVAVFWTSDEAQTGEADRATDYNFTEDIPQVHRMPMTPAEMPEQIKSLMARLAAEQTPEQKTYKEARKIYGLSLRCVKD